MSSERIRTAMDRIDRALARIETQAALKSHAPSGAAETDTEIAVKHEALRQSVSESLDELDILIGRLER